MAGHKSMIRALLAGNTVRQQKMSSFQDSLAVIQPDRVTSKTAFVRLAASKEIILFSAAFYAFLYAQNLTHKSNTEAVKVPVIAVVVKVNSRAVVETHRRGYGPVVQVEKRKHQQAGVSHLNCQRPEEQLDIACHELNF